jgi:hypothetical protein
MFIIELVTNPALISLIIGLCIGFLHLCEIPNIISYYTALYLVFSIGLKGGISLGTAGENIPLFALLLLIGIIIGAIQPCIYNWLLKKTTDLDQQTAIVIATQYGSISIITFLTALTFVQRQSILFDSFMPAIAGVMELPAIITGLALLRSLHLQNELSITQIMSKSVGTILFNKKISFLFIGFLTGYLLHNSSSDLIITGIFLPFTMILSLFMVDMGIKIIQQRSHLHQCTWAVLAFGIYTPIISGITGIGISYLIGTCLGTAVLFATLIASASYIAVPAIMSSQAPQAKEIIYMPLALAITLPFNIIIGIPLLYAIANVIF